MAVVVVVVGDAVVVAAAVVAAAVAGVVVAVVVVAVVDPQKSRFVDQPERSTRIEFEFRATSPPQVQSC